LGASEMVEEADELEGMKRRQTCVDGSQMTESLLREELLVGRGGARWVVVVVLCGRGVRSLSEELMTGEMLIAGGGSLRVLCFGRFTVLTSAANQLCLSPLLPLDNCLSSLAGCCCSRRSVGPPDRYSAGTLRCLLLFHRGCGVSGRYSSGMRFHESSRMSGFGKGPSP
jgi:hypothetical protein